MKTLCTSCKYGTVIELKSGNTYSYCHEMMYKGVIKSPVESCTTFEDKRFTDKYDLEKIAWELNLSRSGNFIGFKPPKKSEEL